MRLDCCSKPDPRAPGCARRRCSNPLTHPPPPHPRRRRRAPVCLIPTAVLAVAAGALFGFWRALALIWAACIVGETLAFELGRHLFRASIERAAAAWPTWGALEAALREDGWKLVLLLRCCPASPFTLLNYALGSTSLPFSHYFWPSVFGIAPGIAIFVYAG